MFQGYVGKFLDSATLPLQPSPSRQVIQVDQNFGRSHRADARIAPCVIPKGKYVVTGAQWRLLGEVLAEFFFSLGFFLGEKMALPNSLGE